MKTTPPNLKNKVDSLIRTIWYNEDMLEGKCLKCGTYRIGWSLRFPRNQTCPKCGDGLEITEGGRPVSKGYSPFTAEIYTINLPANAPPSSDSDKEKRSRSKNKWGLFNIV